MPPYRSAFDGYRTWSAPKPADWRSANDTALRLGGHAGHLRGANAGAADLTPDPKPGKATDSPGTGRVPEPAGKAR